MRILKYVVLLLIGFSYFYFTFSPEVTNDPKMFEKIFRYEAFKKGVLLHNFEIEFVFLSNMDRDPDGTQTVGICNPYHNPLNNKRIVFLNKDCWLQESYEWKKLLVLHELYHCLKAGEHREGYISIMNSTLMDASNFEQNEEYYINELFYPRDMR